MVFEILTLLRRLLHGGTRQLPRGDGDECNQGGSRVPWRRYCAIARLDKRHEFHTDLNAADASHNFLEQRYRPRAARASWTEMLAFFSEHLKRGATP